MIMGNEVVMEMLVILLRHSMKEILSTNSYEDLMIITTNLMERYLEQFDDLEYEIPFF